MWGTSRGRGVVLALVLAGMPGGPTAGPARGADNSRRDQFYVAGAYEPRDGKLAWRPGFWARRQPGWQWIPAGWVRLRSGWGFQPGYWVKAGQPFRTDPSQRAVTVIMPGPGIPEVHDAAPTFVAGDPEQFASKIVGPIMKPEVVNSTTAMDRLVDRPIDWRAIELKRAANAGLIGWRMPAWQPSAPGAYDSPGVSPSILPMSPAFYIGNAQPGTSYPSYSLSPAPGGPGQSTYIGNSLPGTSYPSYSFSPSPVPGASFYIGNSLPGTSYPTYSPDAAGSVGGYGYGTAPPGNTAGQSPVR
jgi:hypothetical protein